MVVRTLFRTGNSMVVALPKEMLDALQLSEGGPVTVDFDATERRITIGPLAAKAEGVDTEFARQVAEFIEEYRPALEALAR